MSDTDAERFFAQTYAEARTGFLDAAAAAGLHVHSHVHPLRGRDGETLALDVARSGPADAPRLLLVSSACHGVEGFCGNGVQRALLADPAFHAEAAAAGTAVLYLHALNPWGFSWWRRTTQENVDLNRNWQDFSRPDALPANMAYDEIAHLLVPASWPPPEHAAAALQAWVAAHGQQAFQAAVSGGQYTHPQGLFYGGRNPTWSHQTLRQVLREHATRCRSLGWIDLHTGLGPSGHGERIFAGSRDPEGLALARAWWGPEVTSVDDGSSSSAPLTGLMWTVAAQEAPQARRAGIALEYGTLPVMEVLTALRADQWLENHPEAPQPLRQAIKHQLRDAFYTDTPDWKARIVAQGLDAAREGLRGLAAGD
jgi:hypothetical protein